MIMSARVLRVKGQFLYLPNCMIISFDDTTMHTTEVHLVKQREGVDLGKFQDTFVVYKNVVHDRVRANEATEELNSIMERADKVPRWIRVLTYGLASVSVGPFAFQARPIDFPFMFVLGCILGYLQLVVAPRSDQFRNVFEVLAAVVTSFCARGLGSIVIHGKQIFCFSAMAQSSIALILPGYIILCAALELQSRNIVAGSVRMVYAIIYALFLGFGITIGTALFGLMWPKGATSAITCHIPPYWSNTMLTHWPFVPIFTFCLVSTSPSCFTPRSIALYSSPPFPSLKSQHPPTPHPLTTITDRNQPSQMVPIPRYAPHLLRRLPNQLLGLQAPRHQHPGRECCLLLRHRRPRQPLRPPLPRPGRRYHAARDLRPSALGPCRLWVTGCRPDVR